MLIDSDTLCEMVPHAGAMCLLDGVLEWDPQHILCISTSHRTPANPLRLGGRLRAVHGVEYGAQAMAAHGALLADAQPGSPMSGYLTAVRDLRFSAPYLEDFGATLQIRAERVMASSQAVLYALAISGDAGQTLTARVSVVYTRRASDFGFQGM